MLWVLVCSASAVIVALLAYLLCSWLKRGLHLNSKFLIFEFIFWFCELLFFSFFRRVGFGFHQLALYVWIGLIFNLFINVDLILDVAESLLGCIHLAAYFLILTWFLVPQRFLVRHQHLLLSCWFFGHVELMFRSISWLQGTVHIRTLSTRHLWFWVLIVHDFLWSNVFLCALFFYGWILALTRHQSRSLSTSVLFAHRRQTIDCRRLPQTSILVIRRTHFIAFNWGLCFKRRSFIKDIDILQSMIELLDDGDFLIIKMNFMPAHDIQQRCRCKATKIFVFLLMLHDFQHP